MRCAGWKMQCTARQAKQASPGEGTGRYRVTGNISWARTSVIHLQEQQPPPSLVNALRKQKVPVQTAQSVLTLPRQLKAACGHQEDPECGSTSSCPPAQGASRPFGTEGASISPRAQRLCREATQPQLLLVAPSGWDLNLGSGGKLEVWRMPHPAGFQRGQLCRAGSRC